jgi:hypothetical protein
MPTDPKHLQAVLTELGYRPLSRLWAKCEILLGLGAVFAALVLALPVTGREPVDRLSVCLAAGLFILGGYLTLAGHRSHLYQSSNERLVLLREEIRALQQKDKPS